MWARVSRAAEGGDCDYTPCRLVPSRARMAGLVAGRLPVVPIAGDKPQRYIFSFRHRPSVYNSARFAGGEPASRLIGGHIPDRSPGHAFVRMTNLGRAGLARCGCEAWGRVSLRGSRTGW